MEGYRRVVTIGRHLLAQELVRVDKLPGSIGLIQMNSGDGSNMLNREMIDALLVAFARMDRDDEVKVVVMTGTQKAFSVGADIGMFLGKRAQLLFQVNPLEQLSDILCYYRKPIIAAVSGICIAEGLEIALHCDIVVSGQNAVFGLPQISLGLVPGTGATQRIPKLAGKGAAMRLIMTGEQIDAAEAARIGIVNQIAEEDPVEASLKLAAKISVFPLPSLILAKSAIGFSQDSNLAAGERREFYNFITAFSLEDKDEGIKALFEKRKPDFKDK